MSHPKYSSDPSALAQLQKGPCMLSGWDFWNGLSAVCFVQLFDAADTADVTLGTTVPNYVIAVPATSSYAKTLPESAELFFKSGCCYAVTTNAGNATAPTWSTGTQTGDFSFALGSP